MLALIYFFSILAKNLMSKLIKNMLNKLSPHVKLQYSQIRGNFTQRQNKAIKLTEKLYEDILPKFKKEQQQSKMSKIP